MEDVRDVLPVGSLSGKMILSLRTGNKLGLLEDLFIDPINGVVLGITMRGAEGENFGLRYDDIYSFGHDAVMAVSEEPIKQLEEMDLSKYPRASDLIGTKILTVSGNMLGQIRNVFVTLQPPPVVVYSVGESMLHRLLGREFYILASAGNALSDDTERLVVPDATAENSGRTIDALLDPPMSVKSHETRFDNDNNDTWVVSRDEDDEFETVLHSDDDDTVIRIRRDLLTPDEQPG
jgi:uncharacterized protein YrrD